MRLIFLSLLLTHAYEATPLIPRRELQQEGRPVRVSTSEELTAAAETAQNGDTIVIQARRLELYDTIRITARSVELRGGRQGVTITCPEASEALTIASRDVRVTDIQFVGCRNTSAVTIQGGEARRVSALFRHVVFQNNRVSTLSERDPDDSVTERAPLVIRRCPPGTECRTRELTVRLESSNFTDNQAHNGGAIQSQTGSLIIEDCWFSGNQAISGGAIYVSGTGSSLAISNSAFIRNRVRGSDAILSAASRADGRPVEPTQFWIFERPRDTGGAIYVYNAANVTLQKSQFLRNRAPAGGAVTLRFDSFNDASIAQMANCNFHQNRAKVDDVESGFQLGGALYIDSTSESLAFRIQHCNFTENRARFGGALHLVALETTQPRIEDSLFANNTATEAGGALLLRNTGEVTLHLVQCLNNFALLAGCAMVTNRASLSVTGVFQGADDEAIRPQLSNNQAASGGAIACARCGVLSCSQALFENNTAGFSRGAIYVLESDSEVRIEQTTFLDNAAFTGGALAVEDTRQLNIEVPSTGSQMAENVFEENLAVSGAAIHAHANNKRANNLEVQSARFESNAAILLADFVMDPRIAALMERLENEVLYPDSHGDLEAVLLSRVSPCQQGGGGALCLVLDSIPEQATVEYKLMNSVIAANEAVVGGGLFAGMDPETEWNENGNEDSPEVGDVFAPCRHFSMQSLTVQRNQAAFAPGIFTHHPRGIIVRCNSSSTARTLFELVQTAKQSRPSAVEEIFGDMCSLIAGNARSGDIELIEEGRSSRARIRNQRYIDVGTGLHELKIPESMQNIRNHTGGERLLRDCTTCRDVCVDCPADKGAIEVDVLDMFGQRILAGIPDASQEVLLTSDDIRGSVRYEALNGVIQLDSTVGLGIGSSSRVKIEAIHLPEISTELEFTTRDCLPGERPGPDSCSLCSSQQYSFDPSLDCQECEDHAVCTGGAVLVPGDGFWHSTPFSPQFHECIFREACIHEGREDDLASFYFNLDQLQGEIDALEAAIVSGDAFQYQPVPLAGNETSVLELRYPQCATGYSGVLCGSCIDGYGRLASGECRRCTSKALAGFLMFLMALWMTVFVGINVLSAIESTRRQIRLALHQQPGADIELQHVGGRVPPRERLPNEDENGQPQNGGLLVAGVADRIVAMLKITETVKIFINYCQVTSAAMNIDIRWPVTPKTILRGITLVVGFATGTSFRSLSCFFGSDADDPLPNSIKYLWMRAVFPFIILAFFCLICGVYFWSKRKQEGITQPQNQPGPSNLPQNRAARAHMSCRSYLIVITIVVIFYSYISVTTELIKTMNCIGVDESGTGHVYESFAVESVHRVWVEDTALYCWKGDHTATGVFGILGFIVFSCGSVFFVMTWLPWNADRLGEPEFIAQYGFIYQGYRELWYTTLWEGVIASRKACVAAALTFSIRLGPNLQALSALGVIILSIALQIVFRPFKRFEGHPNVPLSEIDPLCRWHWWNTWNNVISLNILETVSLFMSGVVFYAGLVFNDNNTTDGGRATMAVFMAVTNVVFLVYMVYRLYAGVAVALDYACGHIRRIHPDAQISRGHHPLAMIRKAVTVFKERAVFDMDTPMRPAQNVHPIQEHI